MPSDELSAMTHTLASADLSILADAQAPDFNQRLDNAAVHTMWLKEAKKGLADITSGHSSDARASILATQTRRAKENNLVAKINPLG